MWGNIHSKLAVPMAMRPELSLFHVLCDLVGSLKLLLFCLARQIAPTSTSSEGLSFPSWTIHVLRRPSSSLKSPVTACHSSFDQQPPQGLIASSSKLHNRRTPHSASACREISYMSLRSCSANRTVISRKDSIPQGFAFTASCFDYRKLANSWTPHMQYQLDSGMSVLLLMTNGGTIDHSNRQERGVARR